MATAPAAPPPPPLPPPLPPTSTVGASNLSNYAIRVMTREIIDVKCAIDKSILDPDFDISRITIPLARLVHLLRERAKAWILVGEYTYAFWDLTHLINTKSDKGIELTRKLKTTPGEQIDDTANWAAVCSKLKLYDLAESAYKQVAKLDPRNYDAHMKKANLCASLQIVERKTPSPTKPFVLSGNQYTFINAAGGILASPSSMRLTFVSGTTPPPIKLNFSRLHGLGMFATRNIADGETILVESPWFIATIGIQQCAQCGHDMKHVATPFKCITCHEADQVYCSTTCCDAAMNSWHGAICGVSMSAHRKLLNTHMAKANTMAFTPLMALRIIGTIMSSTREPCSPLTWNDEVWQHILQMIEVRRPPGDVAISPAIQTPFQSAASGDVGEIKLSVVDQARLVSDLKRVQDDICKPKESKTAQMHEKILQRDAYERHNGYIRKFGVPKGSKFEESALRKPGELKLKSADLITATIHTMQPIIANSVVCPVLFDMHFINIVFSLLMFYSTVVTPTCRAIFKQISMINHACAANAGVEWKRVNGKYCMVLSAERDIETGEEITINYLTASNLKRCSSDHFERWTQLRNFNVYKCMCIWCKLQTQFPYNSGCPCVLCTLLDPPDVER